MVGMRMLDAKEFGEDCIVGAAKDHIPKRLVRNLTRSAHIAEGAQANQAPRIGRLADVRAVGGHQKLHIGEVTLQPESKPLLP